MGDLTDLKDFKPISDFLSQITADAIVATRPWKLKVKKGEVSGLPLTRCTIGPGSWMLAGQCNYALGGGPETELEIKLNLRVMGDDRTKPLYDRSSYVRLEGGDFGTVTVIGAVNLEEIVWLELTYDRQIISQPSNAYPSGCDPENPIITAIRVPSLFVLS